MKEKEEDAGRPRGKALAAAEKEGGGVTSSHEKASLCYRWLIALGVRYTVEKL